MSTPSLAAQDEAVAPLRPGTVSFVIPNFNHARYLGDAIRSALAQTHGAIEVIVVDDGSTDDSRSVAAEFGDRIRYIYQRNAGLSAARNTGVQAAQGDYIALLDADDLVEPDYALRLLEALAATPGADGAYCGFRFVDQDGQPLSRVEQRLTPPEELYGALLNGNYWVPESLLAHRSLYLAMGEFDTDLRACEDWDVWLRFSRSYKLVGIADVLIRYRVVVGSMSSDPRRMLDNRLTVLAKHLGPQPPAGGVSRTHSAYAHAYFRTALEYYQYGDEDAAYTYLLAGARLYPALLLDHATYYELACSEQTRGSQGDVQQLDVARRQAYLRGLVDRLAFEPGVGAPPPNGDPTGAGSLQSRMQARALWAIALLNYQSGASTAARTALMDAARLDPTLLRQKSFGAALLRSTAGARPISWLKRAAGRP
jgi:glycosyltransferase involved in cell wall biosynthesis